MNEQEPEYVEESKEVTDFSKISRESLRGFAQDLIKSNDIAESERLRDYAKTCLDKLPYNTAYSTEWDYWNYVYLIGEIEGALSPGPSASTE